MLRRPEDAAARGPVRAGGASKPRCASAHPRRAQLRRGGGAVDRQRPPHGLHRDRTDDAPRGPHGADGDAGHDPVAFGNARPRGGLRADARSRPAPGEGRRDAARRIRAGRCRTHPLAPARHRGARAHALRGSRLRDRAARERAGPGARRLRATGGGGGGAGCREVQAVLGVHPLEPHRGLARARIDFRVLRQGHGVPAHHRPAAGVLQDRGAGRAARHAGEGHRQAAHAGREPAARPGAAAGPAGSARRRPIMGGARGRRAAAPDLRRHQARRAARELRPARRSPVRGPALDRRRDAGATRHPRREPSDRTRAAARQLPARVPTRLGRQELLHAAPHRSTGHDECGGAAGRPPRRQPGHSSPSSDCSLSEPRAIPSSSKSPCAR